MSHNLLRLARNLRRERVGDNKIVYKNKITSWSKIFKEFPLNNNSNLLHFHNMEHCKEYWGNTENPIVVLRSGYTWDLLRKIAKNSIDDCFVFYQIAQNVLLNKNGEINKNILPWFKKVLSAIYLSEDGISENLNFLNEISQEHKEEAVFMSLRYFAEIVLPQYEKHLKDFNVENFNEKLLLNYWHADSREHNFLDRIIDKLNILDQIDIKYVADKFKPNSLLKYQSFIINEKYIPFEKIMVLPERYDVDSVELYFNGKNFKERMQLSKIFNLFCVQKIIKDLEKASFAPTMGNKIDYKFINGKNYIKIEECFMDFQICNEMNISMLKFIEKNKESTKNNYNFWKSVESVYLSIALNQELETNLNKKTNKDIKLKV